MPSHHDFEDVFTPNCVGDSDRSWFVGPTLSRQRLFVLTGVVAGVFLLFFARSFQLAVLEHDQWKAVAERNRTRAIGLPGARGEIRDRNGQLLATNTAQFALVLFPNSLPKEPLEREKTLERLSGLLGIDRSVLTTTLSQGLTHGEYIVLRDHIAREDALPLMSSLAREDARVLFRPEREYRDKQGGLMLGNVLGFTGRVAQDELQELRAAGYRADDLVGKQGLELSYERLLRGTDGRLTYAVGADGSVQSEVSSVEPRSGQELTLTLDAELQETAARAFRSHAGAKSGAVVVLDADSGAIRALLSAPDFSPNIFTGGRNSGAVQALLLSAQRPLFARAISGQYPSGSTIKPFFAIGALSDKIITPQTAIQSRGGIQLGASFFPDWKAGGHGRTTLSKAIAESVNTFFYLVLGGYPLSDGQYPQRAGIGLARMAEIAAAFGFGKRSDIDLPAEAPGFFPTPEWKQRAKQERWYVGDTYHLAIGQGDLLVSPIQLAAATLRIANAGKGFRPFLVQSRNAPSSALPDTGFSAEAFQTVGAAMRRAVTDGSARRLFDLPIAVAGKTGTAQWHARRAPHSWFIGYAPYRADGSARSGPRVALAVLVEEGGEGSGPALSIAKDIFQWVAEHPQATTP